MLHVLVSNNSGIAQLARTTAHKTKDAASNLHSFFGATCLGKCPTYPVYGGGKTSYARGNHWLCAIMLL